MDRPVILNADGSHMKRCAQTATNWGAASTTGQELASWYPGLVSPDRGWLWERNTAIARVRDLVRNDGWASGAIRREVDSVIGSTFRLSAKPDWRALGLSVEWARDWATQVEALWRIHTEDPGRYADLSRQLPTTGLFGQAYHHYAVDGEALGVVQWRPGRGSVWATCLQIVHPDRLSNPLGTPDGLYLRGGVELDDDGVAVAHHIRDSHPSDLWPDDPDRMTWTRVPRETPWGRPIVIHHFDQDEAGQHRGVGRLTAIVERLRMLSTYDRVELQAAVINAIFAAYLESPFDHEMLSEALSDGRLPEYQAQRASFHDQRAPSVGGARLATLFPGERLNVLNAARPAAQFDAFESAVLRNIAAGSGLTYEQVSADWSKVNYSSARAALIEVWRTLATRRDTSARGFTTPYYAAWLEETIDLGLVELPAPAPDFHAARAAWCRCKWIGPGRGWVDPTKEAQASQMRMDAALSTLEDECAEQGKDYEEVLEQRRVELALIDRLGLPRPAWADQAPIDKPADDRRPGE